MRVRRPEVLCLGEIVDMILPNIEPGGIAGRHRRLTVGAFGLGRTSTKSDGLHRDVARWSQMDWQPNGRQRPEVLRTPTSGGSRSLVEAEANDLEGVGSVESCATLQQALGFVTAE